MNVNVRPLRLTLDQMLKDYSLIQRINALNLLELFPFYQLDNIPPVNLIVCIHNIYHFQK